MGLYDIIDEISSKKVTKTETGDERIYGVVVGVVAKNYDEKMPGRLCVTIPTRNKDFNTLQWAKLAMPSGGKTWGHFFMPEVEDQVLLVFEDGLIEKPYVIGCIPKDNDKILTGSVDEKNQFKKIVTKHGSSIIFEDNKDDEDGAKDKLTIQTAQGTHQILLNNEKNSIVLTDKEKKSSIEMVTGDDGKITIKTQKKFEVNVGDKVKLTMNGDSGALKIEADSVEIKGTNQVKVLSDTKVALSSASVSLEANSGCKIKSDAMVTIKGAPVKLG